MSESIDALMERASTALVSMDYLTCETLCLEALAQAREQRDWANYGAVLLPLQESRRQRRIIAAEGVVRLGTKSMAVGPGAVEEWVEANVPLSVVLTEPHSLADARRVRLVAKKNRDFVEVLFAEIFEGEEKWTLRSFAGPNVEAKVSPPPREWVDVDLKADSVDAQESGTTPGDWFIRATEALGNAAMLQANAEPDLLKRLGLLEAMMEVVTDHELIHQALGKTARALAQLQGAGPSKTGTP